MATSKAWALAIAAIASVIATFCGARVWLRENAYASTHPPSSLTDVLQTLGTGVFFLGIVGLTITFLVYRADD